MTVEVRYFQSIDTPNVYCDLPCIPSPREQWCLGFTASPTQQIPLEDRILRVQNQIQKQCPVVVGDQLTNLGKQGKRICRFCFHPSLE